MKEVKAVGYGEDFLALLKVGYADCALDVFHAGFRYGAVGDFDLVVLPRV